MAKTQREKIGVPFHPLTKEEIKQWYRDKLLTSAGYLLAIKKVTRPPGTSLVIPNVLKFCKEWEISKSAFYRAVNELREKGYTDWEATQGIVLQETQKIIYFPSDEKCPACGTDSHERDADSHERDADSHERDADSHERDADSHERENKKLKPLPNNDSSTPQIYQTYSDFIQTLSEEERANFLKFCQEKIKNLSQEVNDIEAWLAHKNKAGRNRWEVYYEKYLASKQTQAKKAATRNPLDEFRRELEERQQQIQRAWEESQRQNRTLDTGGAT
jgi:hypothetical protein